MKKKYSYFSLIKLIALSVLLLPGSLFGFSHFVKPSVEDLTNPCLNQAEDQVVNTSFYANGECGGGSNSEMMHCNGYIQFNVSADNVPVTGVSISPDTAIVAVRYTVNLLATVSPGNASNKAVSWSSNDTNVATVNSRGVVIGVSEGSAIITVTTADGNKTATSAITVSVAEYCLFTSISIPFTQDGVGKCCWVTTDEIAYVNSWGMTELTINGVDYTNIWSCDLPAPVNGEWLIYYRGYVSWAHFEALGWKNAVIKSEHHSAFDVKMYPNPTHSWLTIEFGHELTEEAWIQLFDSTGRLIKTCKAQGTQQNINMDSLPSGLYMVKVSNSTENIVKRILKK